MKIKTHTEIRLVYTTEELKEKGKLKDVIDLYPDGYAENIPHDFSLTPDYALLIDLITKEEYEFYENIL